jgi:maspardin
MNYLNWIILLVILLVIVGVYLIPVRKVPFVQQNVKANPKKIQSLVSFRETYPSKGIDVDGFKWDYLTMGRGKEIILFLHGMTGSYDIWWQQMEALKDDFRIISVTYPPLNSLEKMRKGIWAVMDQEKVDQFNLVGTSLGGYFAQYLVARDPDHIRSAVFSNTFPPNKIIAQKNKIMGLALRFLPEWLVINFFRGSFKNSIYPTSGNDEFTLAFLNELSSIHMRKSHMLGRFHCVIEPFMTPDVQSLDIPVMIIESDNDPLIESTLREALRKTYSKASVYTFYHAGHFPYLNLAKEYTDALRTFFKNNLPETL